MFMRNLLVVVLLFTNPGFSQINFEQYFENKSLRLDYFHTGNSTEDNYSFDELIEEPFWGGSKTNLIDKFNYGKYKFIVKDYKTGQIIYSRTYST
ncbi:MAG: peptidase M64, partial [Ignavibacterium sp.]